MLASATILGATSSSKGFAGQVQGKVAAAAHATRAAHAAANEAARLEAQAVTHAAMAARVFAEGGIGAWEVIGEYPGQG